MKLLGIFGVRQISEWRHILGDQKFSKLIDYLAYRIIQEDIEYGAEVTRDTQLLIEFLHDLAGDFISVREFERLCDSLIEAIPKSFDQEINIGDIRNFLEIKRFGKREARELKRIKDRRVNRAIVGNGAEAGFC